MTSRERIFSLLALAAVCIIWGTTYLALKIGVMTAPPVYFATVRQLIAGGLVLMYFALRKKIPKISRSYLWHQAIVGFLLITIGNGIGTIALKYLDSGIASLFATLSPFIIVLFNSLLKVEKQITWVGLLGMVLAFAGTSIVLQDNADFYNSRNGSLGLIFFGGAMLGWAFGSIYTKTKTFSQNAFLSSGFQMLFGGLFMVPMGLVFEDWSAASISGDAFWALCYLIIIGSIVAFGSYIYALSKLPATLVSVHSYVNPIIALYVGWLVLDERLNWNIALASALIFIGVYLVSRQALVRRQLKNKSIYCSISYKKGTYQNV